MSKIGKKPINLPKGVEVKVSGDSVTVKGPKGTLNQKIDPAVLVEVKDSQVLLSIKSDDRRIRAKFGLYRALLANHVFGVTEGFIKNLEMSGVGYRAAKEGKKLVIQIGYSHPVEVIPPDGVSFELEGQTKIKVIGADRSVVGQVAADIKTIRPVEPYKGKGIKYGGQYVRRKAGKAAKAAGAAA
ncbi:MAG: 50S ribosomal protein L6 [Candidatus Margulisiibacteriota bacterium]